MTLRPKSVGGALVPLYRPELLPRPPAELWQLLKAAVDTSDMAMARSVEAHEEAGTHGQRAMALVHDLASERRDLQRSMDKAVNQMMALAMQLKVEGVEGVAGQVREQAQRLDQIAANQRMLLTNQHRIQTDLKNLEAAVRELMRQKAPANRS